MVGTETVGQTAAPKQFPHWTLKDTVNYIIVISICLGFSYRLGRENPPRSAILLSVLAGLLYNLIYRDVTFGMLLLGQPVC